MSPSPRFAVALKGQSASKYGFRSNGSRDDIKGGINQKIGRIEPRWACQQSRCWLVPLEYCRASKAMEEVASPWSPGLALTEWDLSRRGGRQSPPSQLPREVTGKASGTESYPRGAGTCARWGKAQADFLSAVQYSTCPYLIDGRAPLYFSVIQVPSKKASLVKFAHTDRVTSYTISACPCPEAAFSCAQIARPGIPAHDEVDQVRRCVCLYHLRCKRRSTSSRLVDSAEEEEPEERHRISKPSRTFAAFRVS